MHSPTETRAPLRALVVDDEPLARDCVRLALRQDPDIEVVGECGDGSSAISAIRRHSPDLVFLDVQMPGRDGFDVIAEVGPERMPPVVFVTAYDAHALRAFELHAIDYLLKPFDDARFARSLRYARHQLQRMRDGALADRLTALLAERAPSAPYASRLLVRSDDKLEFWPVESLDWVEASGNYVRVHSGNRAELVRTTLASLLDVLDPRHFVRIHRSTIVNLSRVRAIHPWFGGDYTAVLEGGRQLRVSRSYRDALLRIVS